MYLYGAFVVRKRNYRQMKFHRALVVTENVRFCTKHSPEPVSICLKSGVQCGYREHQCSIETVINQHGVW